MCVCNNGKKSFDLFTSLCRMQSHSEGDLLISFIFVISSIMDEEKKATGEVPIVSANI